MVQVRTVQTAILGEEVAYPARDFTTDRDPAVSVLHFATLNDDVLGWHIKSSAIGIAPGLDSNTIIAGIKVAVFD